MAAKVETLRVARPRLLPGGRTFVRMLAGAIKRWGERGQLGSSGLEMRIYTGTR